MASYQHETVLLTETVNAIEPLPGRIYADVTVGGGGHSEAVLERSNPTGKVVAMDRDPAALSAARERLSRFGDRVTFVRSRMSQVERELGELGVDQIDGLIADVGVSSPQLDSAERGFSMQLEGPLDMRMDPTADGTALALIESLDTEPLANLLFELGDERRSRAIARSIHDALGRGELETTSDLRRAVHRVTGPKRFRKGRRAVDPATRTFQALRIAVNAELDELSALLKQLPDVLSGGAVVAIISFHSLEDRLVKHAFRDEPTLRPLTKKPVVASEEEHRSNPRARSAKLRAARRVALDRPELRAEECATKGGAA